MFESILTGLKRGWVFVLLFVTALVFSFAPDVCAQEADTGTIILDTTGYWRCHYSLKPPVVRKGGTVEKVNLRVRRAKINWIMHETPLPSEDWANPDFDDSAWARFPGVLDIRPYRSVDAKSPFVALLCMRGKFEVTEPEKVKELTLSASYRGGIVAYLNGKEIVRGHLPKGGKVGLEQLGKGYPHEKFDYKKPETKARSLGKVSIPAGTLRKGVNVLAIEVHRTAYDPKDVGKGKRNFITISWGSCGLLGVRLSAAGADGVVPNIARPRGLQVWNSTPLAVDCDMDYGDPNEKLKPIEIVGTRNGAFSGKVVVGSAEAIKGLKVTMSDFRGAGVIPSRKVQIRFAKPDWTQTGINRRYLTATRCFDGLEETPPEEVPVRTTRHSTRARNIRSRVIKPTFGAVVPVWLTVNVPADAQPGDYTANLTIAVGAKSVEVPVKLKVCSFKLPDPQDFRTFVSLVQSPESVAMYYKVPFWSDAHFKYMEKSLNLLGQVGNKVTYLHLVCRSNHGNAQSMVRWVKTGEGKYTYDFTPMDRYLDLIEKRVGKPAVVCLYAWDIHCNIRTQPEGFRDCVKMSAGEVPVSSIDANGKVTEVRLPPFGTPGTRKLWKPLIDGIVNRLKKRGMEKSIMLGVGTDTTPSKQVVEFFTELLPGVPWVHQRHGRRNMLKFHGVPTGYAAFVWGKFADGGGDGWRYPHLAVHSARGGLNNAAMTFYRHLGEINVAGYHRGFGRYGADFFPVLESRWGSHGLMARYPETQWRNLNIRSCMLSPGKDGPIATHRFEMIREGVQECEARIFIEKALFDEKLRARLGEDFATRCRNLLDERIAPMRLGTNTLVQNGSGAWTVLATCDLNWWGKSGGMGYYWYVGSGWQERSRKIYEAAAEVTDKLEGR